jgi:hypothetical protein
MNKEDKRFINNKFKRAETGLKQFVREQVDDSKSELKQFVREQVDDSKTELKQFVREQIDDSKTELRKEMHGIKTELSGQIRHNGIMIEHLSDAVQSIAESNIVIQRDVSSIIKRLDDACIDEIPVIKSIVSDHSKRIARLEKVIAR